MLVFIPSSRKDAIIDGVNYEEGKLFVFPNGFHGVSFTIQEFSYEVIDYLRSPYRPDGTPKPVYDCGYMGVSQLIEAGLAISSVTTK